MAISPTDFNRKRFEAEADFLSAFTDGAIKGALERIERIVDEGDFINVEFAQIFSIAANLHARGRFSRGALEQGMLAAGFTSENADRCLTAIGAGRALASIEALASDVRTLANKARIREVIEWTDRSIADADIADIDLQVMIESALVDAVRADGLERKAGLIADGVEKWLGEVEAAEGLASGLSTGVRALDEMIGGYRRGELIVVGGRPSMGKTIMATTAASACASTGAGVFFASIEMPREQLRARMLCDLARHAHRIEYQALLANRLSPTNMAEIRRAAELLKQYPIIVDDRGGLGAAQIALGARRAQRHFDAEGRGLGLIIIDYLQLMALPAEWKSDKTNGVGANSAALKRLAKELSCPVLLLSQLSRQVEQRDDKRPLMSDLRDSGAIEQDADVILFPFREEYYLQKAVTQAKNENSRIEMMAELSAIKHRIELIVEKQRNGPRGVVKADCDAATSSIRDFGGIRAPENPDLFKELAA